jgi:tetratricopeptide (TPR) repeat protein
MLYGVIGLLIVVWAGVVLAQSANEAINLAKEGKTILDNAKSKDDYERAARKYEEALKISEQVKSEYWTGTCSNQLGVIQSRLGQYQKSLDYYEQSLAISKKIGNVKGEGGTLSNIGSVYVNLGQYTKALDYYEQSLAISKKIGNVKVEGVNLGSIGSVYSKLCQYTKALDYYEQSLAISRKIGDMKGEGVLLDLTGQVYNSWGQYEKALEYYEKALAISQKIGDVQREPATLNKIGLVYSSWGQYTKALEYYEQSLAINRKIGDVRGESASLGSIGTVYNSLGQYDKALEYYEQSLKINRKIGNVSGEGVNLNNIGQNCHKLGQYTRALEYYEQSLKINRKIGNVGGEGENLNNIGSVYWSLGQYQKALECHDKSLAIRQNIGDISGEGTNLNNIATVYDSCGQYQKALEYYEQSLAIMRKIGNVKHEGASLNNIGGVYKTLGQYQKALQYYEKSLDLTVKTGDVDGEGTTLVNIAGIYYSCGQYQKAIEYIEKSLAIMRKTGNVKSQGTTLGNMAQLHQQLGQYDNASSNARDALALKKNIGLPTDGSKDTIGKIYLDQGNIEAAEPFIKEAGYNSSLGWLALLKFNFKQAQNHYEKLLNRAEENRDAGDLFTGYTGLGIASENLGDDESAEEYYRKAVDLTEEVRSSLSRDQREKFFDVRVKGFFRRTAPYDGLARVRLRRGKTTEALKVSEYTKARIFAESMSKRSDSTHFDIAPEVKKQDEDLNDRLPSLKKTQQEAYEKGNKLLIEALEPQIKELEAKLQAHIRMLREKYPVFAATKYPQPMDLEQTALNADEWVLEYHVTDPGIIIYLSKGKQLIKALFKPKPRDDLEKLVLEYRKPLEVVPGKDKLEEKLASFSLPIGKELSDLLLSDVLDFAPKGASIIIVPDDCLGTVPFEMLTLNDKGSVKTDKAIPYVSGVEFFGDRNLLSYYQSVTALTLARNHAKAKAAGGGLLAIVDPVFSERDKRASEAPKKEAPTGAFASLLKSMHLMGTEGADQMGGLKFPRLELTNELAESLAKIDKSPADIIRGFDATKDNFVQNIKPSLKKYDKIVLATHGYFGKDLPGIMEPVLVLTLVPPGTDGFLRMTEVMGLDMNAEIVALTACQTGLGTSVSGEGTMGMGRAFQYAGAKSVLMSLWSVSEIASVTLVKNFFQHLKAGKSKPEALELARGELRRGIWNHPFFWAGFILVGETN